MTLAGLGKASMTRYRHYREQDHRDVVELCKDVYGGADYLPKILAALPEDPCCSPRVIHDGCKVVAFCNVRVFESDDESHDVIYIEAVRVSEAVRGQGFGTRIVEETMNAAVADANSARVIRFLSTTISQNMAMRRIFEKAGWACRGYSEIWPSYNTVQTISESGEDARGQFLDLLHVSSLIPSAAEANIPLWEQVSDAGEILRILEELREGGGSFLLPRYFSLDTAAGASKFLQSKYSEEEGRTIWKLERDGKLPVIVFIRVLTVHPSDQQPGQIISACVPDISGAECCVAFAASRRDLGCFRIVFDTVVTAEEMKKSALLSKVETSTFMIFEARK